MRVKFSGMVVAPVMLSALALPVTASDVVDLANLSLERAQSVLVQDNRQIQSARRRVDAAGAGAVAAGATPNPTLLLNSKNINLDRGNGPGGPFDRSYDTTVEYDQLIERGDKRELRMNSAQHNIEMVQADLAETTRQLRLALAASYYDLLLNQGTHDLLGQTVQLYAKTLQATALRLSAGDIASTDLARLQVEAARAQNDLRQSQADLEKTQFTLASLLGREKEAGRIRATDPWPEIKPLPEITEEMLAQRPDVRAAQARIALADSRRAQARALNTRDVTVGAQYERLPPDARNTLGLVLRVPLFTNYQNQGEIQRAEVDYTDALENLERVRFQALTEVSKLRADLAASSEKLSRYQGTLLENAQKNADAAEFAYNHGALGLIDLLDSRRTLRAVQHEALSAHAEYGKSLAAWQAAVSSE